MENNELDTQTLDAVKRRFPNFFPEDDAFCPTGYWQDCGPLVELFEVDVGPHTGGKWLAYCFKDPANSAEADDPKTAICMAITKEIENIFRY